MLPVPLELPFLGWPSLLFYQGRFDLFIHIDLAGDGGNLRVIRDIFLRILIQTFVIDGEGGGQIRPPSLPHYHHHNVHISYVVSTLLCFSLLVNLVATWRQNIYTVNPQAQQVRNMRSWF